MIVESNHACWCISSADLVEFFSSQNKSNTPNCRANLNCSNRLFDQLASLYLLGKRRHFVVVVPFLILIYQTITITSNLLDYYFVLDYNHNHNDGHGMSRNHPF